MADNAAAKLAAGRKMLKEFQNKKKTEYVSSDTTPQTKNISDIYGDSNVTSMKQNTEPSNVSNIEFSEDRNQMFPSNDSYPPMIFQDPHQSTASSFFDKFPSDNTSPRSNVIPEPPSGENGLPLAGILFTNHSQNYDPQLNNEQFTQPENTLNNTYSYTQAVQEAPNTLPVQADPESNTSDEDGTVPDVKTLVEISKLQQQLQFHIKTVEFLVSEKSELLEKVNAYEKEISNLKIQSEDLGGRLNISRHRASHLEVECSSLRQKSQEVEARVIQLSQEKEQLATAQLSYKSHQNYYQEELEELKTLMNDKILENKDLTKKIEEMTFELNSSNLRFQQMLQLQETHERPDTPLAEKCSQLQQLVENLQRQLSELEGEKNQSSFQFQDYVQQLNQQLETLNEKYSLVMQDNERLKERESQLVNQIIALEKQMQILHRQNYIEEEIIAKKSVLTENWETLQVENNQLKININNMEATLQQKQEEMSELQNQLEEVSQTLQQLQAERPDTTRLNAAMESDRLAAQKATTQNAKMKLDLQHLEKAFEQMTHSKLELAELLQAEKNLSKTLTLKLVETEEVFKETRSQLHAKDEEMIRLQAASSDLQKEIFKQAQIADRLNHYEAQGQSSELLQSELQVAKSTVQSLSEENEKLKKSLQNEDVTETHSTCNHEAKVVETDHKEINNETSSYTITLPTADAMNKLEERFTKLMKEVADLSDEKQKLEHIVLQLQGETETICEYIALYQKQRGILKQREVERNAQLNILSKERENIKAQLESLKGLINEFVPNNKVVSEDNNGFANEKTQTAEKIMTLLTQIKGSHLIEPDENCGGLETFHPCPCCSGKLINV